MLTFSLKLTQFCKVSMKNIRNFNLIEKLHHFLKILWTQFILENKTLTKFSLKKQAIDRIIMVSDFTYFVSSSSSSSLLTLTLCLFLK